MVSGGFDPLHGGHINLLESAKKLGDVLVVGLNSDDWLFRKKENLSWTSGKDSTSWQI